jgi:hypothetical protein
MGERTAVAPTPDFPDVDKQLATMLTPGQPCGVHAGLAALGQINERPQDHS